MKFLSKLLIAAFCIPLMLTAQEEEPKYHLSELLYIKVKVGMEKDFEAAVKKHNDKYHAEEPNKAYLWVIGTGKHAGWYIWNMRGMTFTELDARPKGDAHRADWDKNVAKYIDKYGRQEIWRYNTMLSNAGEEKGSNITVWMMSIEDGESYRFKAFMKKVMEVYKEHNKTLHVYNNSFYQNDGRQVAFVWPFENWAEFDKDDWSIKEHYDTKFGEGSWEDALEEWEDFMDDWSSEVWMGIN